MKKWLTTGIILLALFGVLWYWGNAPYVEIKQRISGLKTEAAVVKVFGKPRLVFHRGDHDYYVSGYTYKERPISNKVFVYFPSSRSYQYHDIILYVYVDARGRVEDYHVGGS